MITGKTLDVKTIKTFLTRLRSLIFATQANLLLGLVYFTVLPIFAVALHLLRSDSKPRGWQAWENQSSSLADVKKQY